MENVPPVYVDVILDPYISNVIPQSLVPTIAYIIVLAGGSWYLSRFINRWLNILATDEAEYNKKNS